MVQEIKRFLTHDGREFPSLELAEEHEHVYDMLSELKHHMEKGLDSETKVSQDDDAIKSLQDWLIGAKAEIFKYYKIQDPSDKRFHLHFDKKEPVSLEDLMNAGVLLQECGVNAYTKLVGTRQIGTGDFVIALWCDGMQTAVEPINKKVVLGFDVQEIGNRAEKRTIISIKGTNYFVINPQLTVISQEISQDE